MVTDEQGAGDILQFVRFLPLLAACAGRVFCRVRHPALLPLLRYNYPTVTFFGNDDPIPAADAHIPLLSCVHRLDVHEQDVPLPQGYLQPPPTTTVAILRGIVWRHPSSNTETTGTVKRVAVCWAGSPTHKRDATRSIPFDTFRPILDVPGLQFMNLTVGPSAEHFHPSLLHPALPDYAESARILAGCDLVVTVDTSVLHLGGALGVPTWGLVAASPDMRWMLNRSDSPWYQSLRLFRQPTHNDWCSVVLEVTRQLESLRS